MQEFLCLYQKITLLSVLPLSPRRRDAYAKRVATFKGASLFGIIPNSRKDPHEVRGNEL